MDLEKKELSGSELDDINDDILPKGPLHHARIAPLPTRIKSGFFGENSMQLESSRDLMEIPWDDVAYVALGMIEEKVEREASAYKMQRIVEGGGGRGNGSIDEKTGKLISYKPTYLLDVYCGSRSECLRFDAAFVNYKSFLGKNTAHISFQNFFRLVHALCRKCTKATFSKDIGVFLTWQRAKLKIYASVNDFETEVFLNMSKPERSISWSDIDFSRDSWATGWD